MCFLLKAQNRTVDSLNNVLKNSKDDSIKVKILLSITDQLLQVDLKQAEISMRKAIALSNAKKSNSLLAETMGYMGFIKEAISEVDSSIYYYEKAIRFCKKANDTETMPVLLNNLSIMKQKKGKLKEAVEMQMEAIKTFEVNKDKKGMSYSYNNAGELFWKMEQWKLAVKYFLMAQELADEIGYTEISAYSANNLGAVLVDSGEYKQAFSQFAKAIKLYDKLGDLNGKAQALQNTGSVYGYQKDLTNAVKYIKEAYGIYLKLKHNDGLIRSGYALGNVYEENGKPDDALLWLNKTFDLVLKANDRTKLPGLYKNMSLAYAQKGQFNKAYKFHVSYEEAKDSIYNAETTSKFQELEAQYQNEKKSLEIDNLKTKEALKDVELQKQYEEVKKQNQQKIFFALGFLVMILLAIVVYRSYSRKKRDNEIITQQKMEVEHQKRIIEDKQKEVMDSIQYAKLIQNAHLPSEKYISSVLKRLNKKT